MKTFKEYINEGLSVGDMLEELENAIGSSDKYDQALWDWFMDNMGDSGIYAGDAVPEDYLEAMEDGQVKNCYKELKKKFKKNLMNEAKTMKRVVVPGSGTIASMKVQIIPASAKLTKLKRIKGIDFFSANDSGKNKLIATDKTLKKDNIYVVATGYDIDDTEWINIILGDNKRAISGIQYTFEDSLEDSKLKIQQQNDGES